MIIIPEKPASRVDVPRLIDFGGFLTPAGGGPVQRLNRLGNRYAVTVTMPPMRGSQARIFVNRLIRGKSEGARMAWPLDGFDPGAPLVGGAPVVVDGSGQAGRQLSIRSIAPHYAFREGQPISLEVDGQHYFDFIAQATVVGAGGTATITLSQMLRIEPPDGAVLHVAKPMIEGFIVGSEISWEQAISGFTEGIQFEIQEAR